jgi:23S rRNA pseudouridine1911/1915/1917 synthase
LASFGHTSDRNLEDADQLSATSEAIVGSEVSFSSTEGGGDLLDEETVLALVAGEAGERLDRWLAAQLPAHSRAEIQRWIDDGLVTVGDKQEKASHKLATGDTVVVRVPAAKPYEIEAEPIPLEIVYEDADLLVIDKPAGMVVHPSAGHWHGTLVNAVLYHCPDLEGVGGVHRPGIVHRLDKDTSGLIVVAKNDRAVRDLQAQFRGREVGKCYLALAYGLVSPASGEIAAAIARDPRERKRMTIDPGGRAAVTRYEVLGFYRKHTLLACHPLTGRTHQIRVHLAHIGHPIVGDTVYGGRRKPPAPCPRQFLHAQRIRFRLPGTGEEVEFTSPLPADLQAVLEALGPHSFSGSGLPGTSWQSRQRAS